LLHCSQLGLEGHDMQCEGADKWRGHSVGTNRAGPQLLRPAYDPPMSSLTHIQPIYDVSMSSMTHL
jgi:hypothetical protein